MARLAPGGRDVDMVFEPASLDGAGRERSENRGGATSLMFEPCFSENYVLKLMIY